MKNSFLKKSLICLILVLTQPFLAANDIEDLQTTSLCPGLTTAQQMFEDLTSRGFITLPPPSKKEIMEELKNIEEVYMKNHPKIVPEIDVKAIEKQEFLKNI